MFLIQENDDFLKNNLASPNPDSYNKVFLYDRKEKESKINYSQSHHPEINTAMSFFFFQKIFWVYFNVTAIQYTKLLILIEENLSVFF